MNTPKKNHSISNSEEFQRKVTEEMQAKPKERQQPVPQPKDYDEIEY